MMTDIFTAFFSTTADMNITNLMIVAILILMFILLVKWWLKKHVFSKHAKNVKRATHILKLLHAFSLEENGAARIIGFLRKIDPFVFEELLLTCLKKQGLKIKRNDRYTGDGGIDGRCKIDGALVLVQAKRYKNHINNAHVEEFTNICINYNSKGLFIHTGRTGAASKKWINSHFDIISGGRLIDLILGRPVSFFPGEAFKGSK
jgi:restriction system protein